MNRYAVKVVREVIVYAEDERQAEEKAVDYLKRMPLEEPATRPIVAVGVVALPPIAEERPGEIIDRAPPRETRT